MSDVRITNAVFHSWYPSLVWTGSEFGVSWMDSRDGDVPGDFPEIYFARISPAGIKVESDVRITLELRRGSQIPSLVWTGSEYGVSWYNGSIGDSQIYFARISSSGVKVGSDVRITNDSTTSMHPSLAWTGSEFGVCWHDARVGNYEIYFARISSTGIKVGSDERITDDMADSTFPSLVWTGSEFGAIWHDERDGTSEPYFARISSTGSKVGSETRITSASSDSQRSSLVWTGSEFGVSWDGVLTGDYWGGPSEIYFARISSTGIKVGADEKISDASIRASEPSLVWADSEFAVSWMDMKDGNMEIYIARISSTGNRVGSIVRITNDPATSWAPSLAWTGSEFGLSWDDERDGDKEIYFNRLGYCP
jgi:hypothetical protein